MVKHGDHGVSHSCLLIELGPICNYMAKLYGSDLRVVRTTAYLKAIMEVYGKNIYRSGHTKILRAATIFSIVPSIKSSKLLPLNTLEINNTSIVWEFFGGN